MTGNQHYEREYHHEVHASLHDEHTYRRIAEINRRRYFHDVGAEHAVFEFGCGLGQNLFALPARVRVGYDISAYAVEFCRRKGLEVHSTMEPLGSASFDFVISRHNLEHMENPLENLRMLRGLLRPAGRLILVVPEELAHVPTNLTPDVHHHLYSWTPRTITNLLCRAGYSVERLERRPNSGRRFFRFLAPRHYRWYALAISLTDRVRRVPGEWVARATPPRTPKGPAPGLPRERIDR